MRFPKPPNPKVVFALNVFLAIQALAVWGYLFWIVFHKAVR